MKQRPDEEHARWRVMVLEDTGELLGIDAKGRADKDYRGC